MYRKLGSESTQSCGPGREIAFGRDGLRICGSCLEWVEDRKGNDWRPGMRQGPKPDSFFGAFCGPRPRPKGSPGTPVEPLLQCGLQWVFPGTRDFGLPRKLERNKNANSTKQRQRVSVRFADVASWGALPISGFIPRGSALPVGDSNAIAWGAGTANALRGINLAPGRMDHPGEAQESRACPVRK